MARGLDHFDAIKIGLTATPAAHTKAFFKEIVYSYDYERVVREGYLVDYDAIAIQSDITIRGSFSRRVKRSDWLIQRPASSNLKSLAIANNEDREYNIGVLAKRLHRISKNITQEGRLQFEYILGCDLTEFSRTLHDRLKERWSETIKTLQSEASLDLCENYPKPEKKFIRAETAEDQVYSRVIFRAKDGRELGPQDYLKEFEKFMKTNPQQIEALEILLKRPREFDSKQLKALREKLASQPDDLQDKFTEKNLRRAYNQELADIISILRYAGKGGELLTVEQRVNKALMKVKSNRSFIEEQNRWLELIRRHLIENLLMEKEDIETLPIFTRKGASWNKLNRIFEGYLGSIIDEINESIAA